MAYLLVIRSHSASASWM